MTTVGLVLGAGGAHAAAFHAGVLGALAEATGWDPRSSEVVVGTSAGAATAVALRAGLPAADLAARCVGEPVSKEGRPIVERVTTPLDIPPVVAPSGPWWPSNPMLLLRELASPGRPRPVVAMAGLLPDGTLDGGSIAERTRQVHPGRWTDQPTWICAVDARTGRRVVFGRDDVDAELGEAVQASSAIPGHLAPVRIDGARYLDGGSHSTTNADLLAPLALDLVVVSSSMTAGPDVPAWPDGPIGRAWHSRTLRREVERIRSGGTTVLVVQPTADDLAVRTGGDLDPAATPEICRQAALTARSRLAHPGSSQAGELLVRAAAGDAR